MHTKESLIADLLKLGIQPSDTLMVHSSMKAIGQVKGGAETVVDALMSLVSDGLLLLPTHTWATIITSHPHYDPATEPACVGIIPNLFMKRKNVYRSLHPTHSIGAYGKRAQEYSKGEEHACTPCPRKGCWGRLYDENAKILFLGASLKTNTYIHSIEEWCKIPNRLARNTSDMFIKMPKGEEVLVKMHRHDHPILDVSHQYDKVEDLLVMNHACIQGRVGDAKSYLISARKSADLIIDLLKKDPDYFAKV